MYKYTTHVAADNNVQIVLNDIFKRVTEHLLVSFPSHFFKNVVIESRSHAANYYSVNDRGRLSYVNNNKEFKISNVERPMIHIKFDRSPNNSEDTFAGSVNQARHKLTPGAAKWYCIDKRWHKLCFRDEGTDISIYTLDAINRVNFNITISVSTVADQESMMNILYNNINTYNWDIILAESVRFAIPNHLLIFLKRLLYRKDLDSLALNSSLSNSEKEAIETQIDNNFTAYLQSKSANFINVYRDFSSYSGNRDLMYSLNRNLRLSTKIEKFQADEGEKRGQVYTNFNITASGMIDFYNITGFLMDFPDYINGDFVDDFLYKEYAVNEKNTIGIKKFHKEKIKNEEITTSSDFVRICDIDDIEMDDEGIDVFDFITNENDDYETYKDIIDDFITIFTRVDKHSLYKDDLYKIGINHKSSLLTFHSDEDSDYNDYTIEEKDNKLYVYIKSIDTKWFYGLQVSINIKLLDRLRIVYKT